MPKRIYKTFKRQFWESIINEIERQVLEDYEFEQKTLVEKINYYIEKNKPVPNKFINDFHNQFIVNVGFGEKYLIRFDLDDGSNKILTLSDDWFEDIRDILRNLGTLEEINYGFKSDSITEALVHNLKSIEVKLINPDQEKVYKNKNGKLFKYTNKTHLDLSAYQIIKENEKPSMPLFANIMFTHCLIHVLEQNNIEESKINAVKLAFEGGKYISTSKLKQVAEIIDKCIVLHKYNNKRDNQSKSLYKKDGKDEKDKIDIAIYEDHYFIFEETIYNEFTIKNYELTKDFENMHNISGFNKQEAIYKETTKLNSLALIHLLFKQGLFESKTNELFDFVKPDEKDIDVILTDINNKMNLEQIEFDYKEKEEETFKIFYADTECLVYNKLHSSFMCGIMREEDQFPKIYMKSKNEPIRHIEKMMKYIFDNTKKGDKIIVYFHNLKYDFSVLKEGICFYSRCIKDGQLYGFKALIKERIIEFRDSYKLFNEPLRKFSKAFNLGEEMNKKEALGYTFYNDNNIYTFEANIEDYIKHVKEEDRAQFYINLNENKKLFEVTDKTFNHMKYYKYYLEYDCRVLCEGLKVYRNTINKITGLNLNNYLTISSLTNSYVAKNGCFDGVYEVSKNVRDYLSKAVYGGRVACLESEKLKKIDKIINDYDACSLYPSAISRLCREYGLPMGEAKQITLDMKDIKILNINTYYVVTINIKKINKKQQIPFIAMRKQNGILDYVNEVPKEGYKCVVDKITLEDYINFHQIEYEILDGIYYDEDTNNKFGEVIEKLYDDRLKEKEKNNAEGEIMQLILKLMMNSSYGKTIIKKSFSKEVIVDKEKKDTYIYNYFNCIKEIEELNNKQSIVKIDNIDDSYNLALVGVMILSMSKRIMNEVMDIANDNDIKVYYQDTDSMHLEDKDIKKLEELYYKKYERKLRGKKMGQFHSDFKIKGFDGIVKSIMSIFLGKKCYLDVLQGFDENGNQIEGVRDYHIRLKGITEAGINDAIKKHGSIENVFEKLINGEKIEFILNPDNAFKPMFEYNNLNVSTRDEGNFKRILQYNKDIDDNLEDNYIL